MSKVTAMFFTVLFLCCMITLSARPEPALDKESLESTQHQDVVEVDESCEGIKDDEECLMRRTLAAHIDYIYTQKHNP